MLVVMAAVDAEHVLKVASAENQDLVETFRADASHPTFGESVRVRGLNGCADYFDAFGAEELVEGVAEFRVAVVDDESEGVLVAELHDEVPRLLCDPSVRPDWECTRRTRSAVSPAR